MSTLFESSGGKDWFATVKRQTDRPQRILVVEDERVIRQLCSEVLIRSGYEVDTAEDGEAGWKVLHAVSYDLMITDNNMPKLSGIGLIEKVRFERMTLPVILASGSPPSNTERLQLAAILPKPFSPTDLVETVKEVLHTTDIAREYQPPMMKAPTVAQLRTAVEVLHKLGERLTTEASHSGIPRTGTRLARDRRSRIEARAMAQTIHIETIADQLGNWSDELMEQTRPCVCHRD